MIALDQSQAPGGNRFYDAKKAVPLGSCQVGQVGHLDPIGQRPGLEARISHVDKIGVIAKPDPVAVIVGGDTVNHRTKQLFVTGGVAQVNVR